MNGYGIIRFAGLLRAGHHNFVRPVVIDAVSAVIREYLLTNHEIHLVDTHPKALATSEASPPHLARQDDRTGSTFRDQSGFDQLKHFGARDGAASYIPFNRVFALDSALCVLLPKTY